MGFKRCEVDDAAGKQFDSQFGLSLEFEVLGSAGVGASADAVIWVGRPTPQCPKPRTLFH
jgi:hypothetical protein